MVRCNHFFSRYGNDYILHTIRIRIEWQLSDYICYIMYYGYIQSRYLTNVLHSSIYQVP